MALIWLGRTIISRGCGEPRQRHGVVCVFATDLEEVVEILAGNIPVNPEGSP